MSHDLPMKLAFNCTQTLGCHCLLPFFQSIELVCARSRLFFQEARSLPLGG